MEKQTAVEYLFEQLWENPKDKFTWYSILEKAKEMEMSQHKKTAVDWWNKCSEHILLFGVEETQTINEYFRDRFKTQ